MLDKDLEESRDYMKGIILDIGGGRKRGNFREPTNSTWIILDIVKDFSPHIVGDAQNIPVKSNSVNCVKCTEFLEHVEYPEKVLNEIQRVLKPGGTLILSTPFNFPMHSDPYDFQRFTDEKLRRMLEDDFEILMLKKQGLYFTVVAHTIKYGVLNSKSAIKRFFYLLLPVLDLLAKLDSYAFVKNSKFMSSFTTGFFIIAVKTVKKERNTR